MVTSSARRCYGTELEKNSRKVFATIQKQTKKFQTQNWLKFSLLMFQYSKSCLRQMFHFFQVCRRTSTGWCLARGVPTPLYTGYHHQNVFTLDITTNVFTALTLPNYLTPATATRNTSYCHRLYHRSQLHHMRNTPQTPRHCFKTSS